MAEDVHELQVEAIMKVGISQKGLWRFSIKNVISILCPRQQNLTANQENNTKDIGKNKRTAEVATLLWRIPVFTENGHLREDLQLVPDHNKCKCSRYV